MIRCCGQGVQSVQGEQVVEVEGGPLSKQGLAECDAYMAHVRSQDDRSCVIMTAARLEFLLRRAIDARLIEPRSTGEDGLGQLPYSGCVSLCYRLGLIHREHADALDALGSISNDFAHFDTTVQLSQDRFSQLLRSFSLPWKADDPEAMFHGFYLGEQERCDSPERALFVVTAGIFVMFLTPLSFIANRLVPLRVVGSMSATDRKGAALH